MNTQRLRGIITAGLLITTVIMTYTNCSSSHTESSSEAASFALSIDWSCTNAPNVMTVFSQTYQPFLMNNCASCHAGNGPGPGSFAAPGVELAYSSFDVLSFSRINARASDGHSAGSGRQHREPIKAVTSSYITGLETLQACGFGNPFEQQDGPTRYNLTSKPINPSLTSPTEIVWNLQTDVRAPTGSAYSAAQFAGMTLRASIEVFQRPGGIVSYIVSNPRIVTTNGDVHVESLLFRLNGTATPRQRTFYLLKNDIRAWNAQHPDFNKTDPDPTTPNINEHRRRAELISGGSMVLSGEVRTTDVISLSIGKLDRVTLPPPDLGPRVRFGQASMSVQEGYQIVNIPLQLDRAVSKTTFVQVYFGGETTIKDQCCRSIRSDTGNLIQVDHFDRDIQDYETDRNISMSARQTYHGGMTQGAFLISFPDGQTSANLRIKIVEDDRDEQNEILHLRINPDNLIGIQPDTTLQEFRLTIMDDDAPYIQNPETFTDLMTDGGLLADQCLRCHNSVDKRGGYDMTNYELLVGTDILVPGAPTESQMYLRMNALITGGLPMPLTGLLPPNERQRVSNWILIGAPNN